MIGFSSWRRLTSGPPHPPRSTLSSLVHGATAGGWEWKSTGKFLTDDGHTVYRATLTGLGEREHLNSPDVDLQTHINDVVNLILYEDLHDVVLTGHSYGGMVITGVIDRIPERIRHVVYLDAAVPDDGMSLWELFGGTGPQDPERFKDGFMQVPWVKPGTPPPHSVKHSVKCFNQPVSYKNPAALKLAGDLRRLRPEGQVGRGAREDGQELAARGSTWLDDQDLSRHPRCNGGRSARRRDAHRAVGERHQQGRAETQLIAVIMPAVRAYRGLIHEIISADVGNRGRNPRHRAHSS